MTKSGNLKKRIMSLLLALVLVISMIPMTSMIAHAETKTYDLVNGFKVTLSDVHCVQHNNSPYHSIKRIKVNDCAYDYNARKIYVGYYIYYDCSGKEKTNLAAKYVSSDCKKNINVSDTYSRGGSSNKITVDYTITRAASEHNCESSTTPANCVSPTKTTYKQCKVCGTTPATTTSGSKNPNNHSWGAWTSNGNGTHTRKCSLNEAHTETQNCSGGTSTCIANGETAKTPNKGTSKFGSEVKVEYKLATENDNKYSTTVPTNAGNYKVRFSVEGNANYTALSKEVDLTIAKKKVAVKAENNSKTYGENDPELTWKRTNGELVGTDILTDISATRTIGEDVDTYTITTSQAEGANPNYDITFETGTFTIQPKTIGIVWGNTSFIYNGETKIPTATATGVEFDDDITFTVSGGKVDANIGSETYTATVTGIAGEKAGNYQLPSDVTTTFTIGKANQSAPSGLTGIPEDIDEKGNGKIIGVDSTMEYRKDEETAYTSVTEGMSELTDLADGTYYIRYKANANHNASPETKIVLSNDAKLIVTIPEVQNGYTLNVDQTELKWNV